MTLQELLKAKGLTDEVIAEIAADMKANKIFLAGEENLDIRYGKLKGEFDALTGKHAEAEGRIAELMAANTGTETLQGELAAERAAKEAIQKELDETRLNSAVKVALLEAKAADIDYMTFKLKEKGEIALDENGKIQGWDDKLAGLKTQFPAQFEASGAKKVEPNKLPDADPNGGGLTRSDVLKKPYSERAKLFNENPEAYEAAMKN